MYERSEIDFGSDQDEAEAMGVSCAGCGQVARPNPTRGLHCHCAHGSCDTCGAPYRSEDERASQHCSQCEEQYEAEQARRIAVARNRSTEEVPLIEDFWGEALRRMGGVK